MQWIAAWTALGLLACAAETPGLPRGSRSARALVLGAGDVVEIKVFREPDLAGLYRVSPEGTIDFPFIGRVDLLGRSSDDVASEIRDRLADGYLKSPQVTVFVREHLSQKIHVLGQVNRAGTIPYESGMTVIEAIAKAGGFTQLAANTVQVTRVEEDKEERLDVRVADIRAGTAEDMELRPGDIVYVPESIF